MQKFLKWGAVPAMLAGLAFAEDFSGRLLDANCVDQSKSKTCDPGSNSTAFMIVVNGKTLRLDDAGNGKAVKAMKGRADRQKDPNAPVSQSVVARVTGTSDGDVIRVDTIEIQ